MISSRKQVCVIGLLAILLCGFGSESTLLTLLPAYESGELLLVDRKTSKVRAYLTYALKRVSFEGRATHRLSAVGKGSYDWYTDVTWSTDAEVGDSE